MDRNEILKQAGFVKNDLGHGKMVMVIFSMDCF